MSDPRIRNMNEKEFYALAHELLSYDKYTGKLFWKERSIKWFKRERDWRWWNNMYSGKELTHRNNHGYITFSLLGPTYFQSARVIWLMVHGKWPDVHIDHINGVRDDNRIEI